jgi:hypothetical protein
MGRCSAGKRDSLIRWLSTMTDAIPTASSSAYTQHTQDPPPPTVDDNMGVYVYALHDFYPENEDEVSFRAGERIEVIEKDDQYGDGWWQVSLFCSMLNSSSVQQRAVYQTLNPGRSLASAACDSDG